MKRRKHTNRIREAADDPTHGVTIHPGILFLSEIAAAVKHGREAVKRVIEANQVYLLGLTIEEGREIAKITTVLKAINDPDNPGQLRST
jgi:phenylpropionate dioxygenase-like ring-hydroxylating dioxygenase large terminal subunit